MEKSKVFYKEVLELKITMDLGANVTPLKEHSWGQRGVRFYIPDLPVTNVQKNMLKVGDFMLEKIPSQEEMTSLIGETLFESWKILCERIEEKYDMERQWNSGGKRWKYEYKYRRGGKTLCALYAKEDCFGFMVILGQAERESFERERQNYSPEVQKVYDESTTYHDGKWLMFIIKDQSLFDDMMQLLKIKRRPNKKQ
jgi:hypothetical protein